MPRATSTAALADFLGNSFSTTPTSPSLPALSLTTCSYLALFKTLHALLYRSPGVTTRMSSETIPELIETVVAAFDKYDILNQQRSINQQTSTWSSLARVMKAAVHWYWQPTRDQSCSPDLGCNAVQ
uniref:Uncharacterized protein n=1 Tax=Timema poppense TaxID=170557 RepID=A0A7R9H941_TIMPO|nr:unnamed protein product [Timema poppensis]